MYRIFPSLSNNANGSRLLTRDDAEKDLIREKENCIRCVKERGRQSLDDVKGMRAQGTEGRRKKAYNNKSAVPTKAILNLSFCNGRQFDFSSKMMRKMC